MELKFTFRENRVRGGQSGHAMDELRWELEALDYSESYRGGSQI
jgi:hypothetical protein